MKKLSYLLIVGFCSSQSFASDLNDTKQKIHIAEQTKTNATKVKVEVANPTSTEPTIASQRALDRAMQLIRSGDWDSAHKELTFAIEKSQIGRASCRERVLASV